MCYRHVDRDDFERPQRHTALLKRLAIDKLKLLMIMIKISRSGPLANLLLPLFLFAFAIYDRCRLATVLL